MNDKQNIDEILMEAFRKNETCVKEFGPDFSKVERGALLKYKQRSKKHRIVLMVRVAAIIVVSLLLINGLMLLTDVRPVQAYRAEIRALYFNLFNNDPNNTSAQPIRRMSSDIDKIQKQVPFKISVPGWIPPGYQFSDVRMTGDDNGIYVVTLEYAFSSGKKADIMVIGASNDDSFSYTTPSPQDAKFDKITVNGEDVYLFEAKDGNISHYSCIFYDKKGLFFNVSCTTDKQSLLKLIGSID